MAVGACVLLANIFLVAPARSATGVFVEGAALLHPVVPITRESRDSLDLPFRSLFMPHFIGPGRGTVVSIRFQTETAKQTGPGMLWPPTDGAGISLITIGLPPVVASFEAGLGDPRVDVRLTEANQAFGTGYTPKDSSGRISVRRDGDRMFIEATLEYLEVSTTGGSVEGIPAYCVVKGRVDRIDLAQLTPWYGLPVPIERQYDARHRAGEPDYGSVSFRCLHGKRPAVP
ncbi:hypothetical protein BWI17_07735 [Betaproteobacteria bacterium GR16-43]|nr:hypothetical protein BWI17_07735 [Betaproteobacteria bacterium GR16-43]